MLSRVHGVNSLLLPNLFGSLIMIQLGLLFVSNATLTLLGLHTAKDERLSQASQAGVKPSGAVEENVPSIRDH